MSGAHLKKKNSNSQVFWVWMWGVLTDSTCFQQLCIANDVGGDARAGPTATLVEEVLPFEICEVKMLQCVCETKIHSKV